MIIIADRRYLDGGIAPDRTPFFWLITRLMICIMKTKKLRGFSHTTLSTKGVGKAKASRSMGPCPADERSSSATAQQSFFIPFPCPILNERS